MNTALLEADTRVLIDTNLKNLGWHLAGKEQNVFFERAKTEKEQRKLGGKRPDYVLYSKNSDTPLVVIEAKKKGERLDTALEQGIFYAKQLDAPLVYATDGVFCKSFHTLGNTVPKLNGEDVDEFVREALALKFLASWEVNTISPKVQYDRKELIRIFDEANNMLRGDGLRAGIERFGEFANILFLKLISENERNRIDYSCSWDAIKQIPPTARIDYINSTVYKNLNQSYGTDIFTPLTMRDNTILKEIMDKLDPLMLTDVDSDIKGDAFEYFLKESTSTKNDLGEYFTPRHIVKTMVRLVNPQIGEKIYDPFCGTGGFLIETFRHIYNNMPRNAKTEKMLKEETIYGNEITNTARITKMNMILAGDGHSNIHMKDSLANPVDGEYDIVLANMPYSQKTKYGSLYDLPSTNGDSICVQHCMKAISGLSDNGRMALVVPEGFLFRKDLARIREYLLQNTQLQSIISLPQGVFLPYTAVKTNIIYATKVNQKIPSTEKRKDFWYFDVKSDGYSLDNHRRKLNTPSDLIKYEEYRKLDDEQSSEMMQVGFEVISLDKVRENSLVLVGSRYRAAKEPLNSKWEMVKIGDVCETTSGGTPLTTNEKFYFPAEIPWINSGEVRNGTITSANKYISQLGLQKSSAKMVPANSVLVAMYGATAGQVGLLKFEASTNQAVCAILPNDIFNPKFLYYVLSSKTQDMVDLSVGGAQPNISQTIIKELEVPLPPLEVQEQIVNEIERYQHIVDGARNVVENYKPTFQIKSEWEVQPLSGVCSFEYGYTDTATDDGDTRFVRITDINRDGTLSNENLKYISLNDENKKYVLNKYDLLVARIGATYGKTLIFTSDETAVFASYLIRLKLDSRVLPKYYFYFAQSDYYWRQARDLVTGGGQPQFNANTIKLINLPIPPLETQHKIVKQIEDEIALIEPSKQLIEVFTKKIQDRMSEIWGD